MIKLWGSIIWKGHREVCEMIYILGAGSMAKETLIFYKDLGRFEEIGGFIEEKGRKVLEEFQRCLKVGGCTNSYARP